MVFLTAARQIRKSSDRYWRKKIIFDQAKHFFGRHRNCYSLTIRAVHRSWVYQNRWRHLKRNNLRRIWISRLEAASEEQGISYSTFISGLVQSNIALDRKILSQLAIFEPKTFQSLSEIAKGRMEEGILASLAKDPAQVLNKCTTQQDLLEEGFRNLRLSKQSGPQSES